MSWNCSYAGRAIRELGLTESYNNWFFPWYVPDSKEHFVEMLEKIGFINVDVSLAVNEFPFPSANAIYRYFNSVGLDLYTSPLNERGKKGFYDRIMRDLAKDFPYGAALRYERIYAEARRA